MFEHFTRYRSTHANYVHAPVPAAAASTRASSQSMCPPPLSSSSSCGRLSAGGMLLTRPAPRLSDLAGWACCSPVVEGGVQTVTR